MLLKGRLRLDLRNSVISLAKLRVRYFSVFWLWCDSSHSFILSSYGIVSNSNDLGMGGYFSNLCNQASFLCPPYPAVSLAMVVAKRMPLKKLLFILQAFLGAFWRATMLYLIFF